MSRDIKVYIHTTSWHISKNNTDVKLNDKLVSIQEKFEKVQLLVPQSFVAGVEFNIRYIWARLKSVLKFRSRKYAKFRISKLYNDYYSFNPDIIIASDLNGYPDLKFNDRTPVIWQSFFINPEAFSLGNQEENEKIWLNEKLPVIEQYASRSSVITFRDYYSIELFKRYFPQYNDKVKFLPFYLPDLEYLEESQVIAKQLTSSVIKILFVGSQAVRKDLLTLIRAFEICYKNFTGKVELLVVSKLTDGEVEFPSGLPITHFNGLSYSETIKLFRESQIYAMTSVRETFGISYIEGMANGCAVIARDFQPQRDMLDYGNIGCLVKPQDVSGLANELLNLCRNEKLRSKLALDGLSKFKKQYYWKVVGEMYINVFKTVTKYP